jgi:hypothetical protein
LNIHRDKGNSWELGVLGKLGKLGKLGELGKLGKLGKKLTNDY